MDCSEAAEFFDAFLDRELSDAEIAGLQEHIHKCRGCAGHLEYDAKLREVLKNRSLRTRLSPEIKNLLQDKLKDSPD